MPMFEGPQAGAAVTMKVEPAEVVRLRAKLQAVRDSVNDFVRDNRIALRATPFADDDVSQDASKDFANNADKAIEVTRQFIDELEHTIDELDKAIKRYNLADDTHASAMQQLNRGA
jgi:exonuclease VII small subunit